MAAVNSIMLELGTKAPDFELPNIDGTMISLSDFEDKKGVMVMFICNHCPYVKHLKPALVDYAKEYMARGIGVVAISSNDVENYPDDSPEKMAEEAKEFGYPFPYLFDESQEVAKAYMAMCTPDFYLFDSEFKLVYRGQFDGSRPKNDIPVTGSDLRKASVALLKGEGIIEPQIPGIGCNIKWKQGNQPEYYSV